MLMRRNLSRLLRLRNLLLLTVIVIFMYLVKLLSNLQLSEYDGKVPEPVYDGNVAQDSLQGLPGYLMSSDMDIVPFQLKSRKKRDWHNYTQINYEKKRTGMGEQGLPAHLPKEDFKLEDQMYSVNGFNGALSDRIPLNRSLPDIRHPGCKSRQYLESLPTVSVVVPFHNEHWSTLLRTAFSVLYRSPEHLIKEIFLVDDASTKDFLGAKLETYLAEHMPKVQVVRLKERSGLIAARLAGARRSSGDVLLFLDSHTEANVNWLPPLLDPIALDWRTVVCPYIDVVAYDTFEYRAQDSGARGAFDWEFFYKRLPLLPADEKNMPDPFPSPVMAGGLFAISAAFFWQLGGYDPGLDIWGGEQYELSFKIWQCGGRMLDAPCSRVGHIYRKFAPFPNPGHGDFVGKNYRRVAEVWMDEYAEYLYSRRPHYRTIDTGDLSDQRALRDKLHCKSFRWFLTQIAFDLTAKYPPVEPKPFLQGRVRPASAPAWCIDSHHGNQMDKLQLNKCSAATEREFVFSWHKDVRSSVRNMCWDLPEAAPRSAVRLFSCHLGGGNQLWRYLPVTKQIRHGTSDNCMESSVSPPAVFINKCSTKEAQRWTVDSVNEKMMARWTDTQERVTGPVEQVSD